MSDKEKVLMDAKERMQKTLHSLSEDLLTIRAGKANPNILNKVQVESYGGHVHLNQLANIFVQDAKTLIIEPWDKVLLKEIEKAIIKSNLGIMPVNDGRMIRLNFPPLTEERRNDLAKMLHKIGEETKVAIRNIRRDANEHFKKMEKDKLITEDELKRIEEEVQKLTDQHIVKIDDETKQKEKEIREV
jgi:ribosome recycling factor